MMMMMTMMDRCWQEARRVAVRKGTEGIDELGFLMDVWSPLVR